MPYILPDQRDQLDPAIDELTSRLCDLYSTRLPLDPMRAAGPLNYVLSRLTLGVLRDFNPVTPSYAILALLSGVLANVQDELYRRVAVPYEEIKIAENGDVRGFTSER